MADGDPSTDPAKLADRLEGEADGLEERSGALQQQVEDVREDWQRKRADESVPGAPPPPKEGGADERQSPAPQAPPEGAGPSAAEMPPEGGAGPPADVIDDDSE